MLGNWLLVQVIECVAYPSWPLHDFDGWTCLMFNPDENKLGIRLYQVSLH